MTQRIVEIVPYDPTWPQQFASEATCIKKALQDNLIAIHHIGSTSIEGMCAKPIIDILCVVKNITDVNTDALEALGYTLSNIPVTPFSIFFQKGAPQPLFHLHIFEEGDHQIDKNLMFIAYLKNNTQAREEYAALKKELAVKYKHDFRAYTKAKAAFIREHNAYAGFDESLFIYAQSPDELEAYTRLSHDVTRDAHHYRFLYMLGDKPIAAVKVSLNDEPHVLLLALDPAFHNQGFEEKIHLCVAKWLKRIKLN